MGFSVTVPAGCGEFLQGRVGNRSVIISTPVNAYVKAIVNDGIYDEKLLGEKSRQAVQRADSICGGRPFDKVLEIQSDIPKGKGMASSSADIGACALAVARHKGYVFSDEALCRLLSLRILCFAGVWWPWTATAGNFYDVSRHLAWYTILLTAAE